MVSFSDPSGSFEAVFDGAAHKVFWLISCPDEVGDRVIRFALTAEQLDDLPPGFAHDLKDRVAFSWVSPRVKYRGWLDRDGFPSQPSCRTKDGRRKQKFMGNDAERLCAYTRFATLEEMARYLVDGTIPEEVDALRKQEGVEKPVP